ncbi:TPA: hypothetical protein I9080_003217 [Clostridium perfringens]|uniref:Uncharacterized protein n=1 Tax=Clostridium perfringens TaxID=1502 RepID=A0A8H9UY91_CLOPF|nr:hypothetical protein [Clostridium perfringens]
MELKSKKYIIGIALCIILAIIGVAQIIFSVIISSDSRISLTQEQTILNNYNTTITNNIKAGKTTDADIDYINSLNAEVAKLYNDNMLTQNVDSKLINDLNELSERLSNYKRLNDIEKESMLNKIFELNKSVKEELNSSGMSLRLGIILISISIIGIVVIIVLASKYGVE